MQENIVVLNDIFYDGSTEEEIRILKELYLERKVTVHLIRPGEAHITVNDRRVNKKMDKDMTWGELFRLFCKRNKDIARYINDYRPGGEDHKMRIWFKNGMSYYVRWIYEIEEFVFSEVED